jgi:hypothetical protein
MEEQELPLESLAGLARPSPYPRNPLVRPTEVGTRLCNGFVAALYMSTVILGLAGCLLVASTFVSGDPIGSFFPLVIGCWVGLCVGAFYVGSSSRRLKKRSLLVTLVSGLIAGFALSAPFAESVPIVAPLLAVLVAACGTWAASAVNRAVDEARSFAPIEPTEPN